MGTKGARTKAITAGLTKALRYRGLIARVAGELNVTRQHAGRVARGERKSRRVLGALIAEIQRIEKETTRRAA